MTPDTRMQRLERWQARAVLRPLDVELGRLMLELDPSADAVLGEAAAAASLALSEGHSCLALARLPELLPDAGPEGADASRMQQILRSSHLVSDGSAPARTPLVLDSAGRLYLRRYFRYEAGVAAALGARAAQAGPDFDPQLLARVLGRHFQLEGKAPDWQAIAVLAGLQARLAVITGGPGTGKTTTVLWLMAAMLELSLALDQPPPRIALAAPTGKAAARLADSLLERRGELDCSEQVRASIPDTATTVHRLLGAIPGSSRFRHHAGNRLDIEVLIVDEASMIDLPLMARLLEALDPEARLVLLGDRHQLASVEAGNVLAAVCQVAGSGSVTPTRAALIEQVTGAAVVQDEAATPFADQVVELRRSWRFGQHSGLGQLAAAVLAGDSDAVIEGLRTGRFDGVAWQQPDEPARAMVEAFGDSFAHLAELADAGAALRQVQQQGILAALREGSHGAEAINAAMDRHLRLRTGAGAGQPGFPGRLIMIRENDYANGLFNGDIGILWPDDEDRLGACFAQAEGVRRLPLSSLPAHASAWAVTIHKSQGSEYDRVSIVLPQGGARILGRELLYTAITRARQAVTILGSEEALRLAVEHSTRRESGLADMLRAAQPD